MCEAMPPPSSSNVHPPCVKNADLISKWAVEWIKVRREPTPQPFFVLGVKGIIDAMCKMPGVSLLVSCI